MANFDCTNDGRPGIPTAKSMTNDAMSEEPIEFILKDFPGTRYYPKFHLTTWHPMTILDEGLAEKVIEFVEWEEYIQDAPFDRYIDFSGCTQIRIKPSHIIDIARRRRIVRQPIKSAFFADNPIGLAIGQVYERLMGGATMMTVRAFNNPDFAAEWLDVPVQILSPPTRTADAGHYRADRR
jgi:hypothetical protein